MNNGCCIDILEWRPMREGETLEGDMIELEKAAELLGADSSSVSGHLLASGLASIAYFPVPTTAADRHVLDVFEAENDAIGGQTGYARVPWQTGRVLMRISLPRRGVWYTLRYRCNCDRQTSHHAVRLRSR